MPLKGHRYSLNCRSAGDKYLKIAMKVEKDDKKTGKIEERLKSCLIITNEADAVDKQLSILERERSMQKLLKLTRSKLFPVSDRKAIKWR